MPCSAGSGSYLRLQQVTAQPLSAYVVIWYDVQLRLCELSLAVQAQRPAAPC